MPITPSVSLFFRKIFYPTLSLACTFTLTQSLFASQFSVFCLLPLDRAILDSERHSNFSVSARAHNITSAKTKTNSIVTLAQHLQNSTITSFIRTGGRSTSKFNLLLSVPSPVLRTAFHPLDLVTAIIFHAHHQVEVDSRRRPTWRRTLMRSV